MRNQTKSAFDWVRPPVTWDEVNQRLRERAMADVKPQLLQVGMAGAGAGAMLAGIRHLVKLRQEQEARERELDSDPRPLRILAKHAMDPSSVMSSIASSTSNFAKDLMGGKYMRRPHHHPLFIPAAAATGVGAAYGGYRVGDAILAKLRQEIRQQEKEDAEKQYTEALLHAGDKVSSESNSLLAAVNRVLPYMGVREGKHASTDASADPGSAHRLLGTLAGLYLTAVGGTGAYGLYKGMDAYQRSSKTKAMDRAWLERRWKEQSKLRPVVTVDHPDEEDPAAVAASASA